MGWPDLAPFIESQLVLRRHPVTELPSALQAWVKSVKNC